MLVSIHTKLYGGMHYINTISRFFRCENPKLHTQMRRWLQIMTREWEKVRSQGLPRSTLHRNLQLTFQGRKTSCEVFRNVCTIHYCLTLQHPLEEFVPFISKEYISHQCDSTGVFPKRFSKGETPKVFFLSGGTLTCENVYGTEEVDSGESFCRQRWGTVQQYAANTRHSTAERNKLLTDQNKRDRWWHMENTAVPPTARQKLPPHFIEYSEFFASFKHFY
jgi:hypothetical protein